MACEKCKIIVKSNTVTPFVPPGDSADDKTFVCPECGEAWSQFNIRLHLWMPITKERLSVINTGTGPVVPGRWNP